jgi:hypothetical protein
MTAARAKEEAAKQAHYQAEQERIKLRKAAKEGEEQ